MNLYAVELPQLRDDVASMAWDVASMAWFGEVASMAADVCDVARRWRGASTKFDFHTGRRS